MSRRFFASVAFGLIVVAGSLSCGGAQKEVERGERLATQQKFPEAQAAFDCAIRSDSASVRAWIGRGQVALLTRRGPDAVSAFKRAVALDPRSEVGWLGLARSDKLLSLNREAIDAYQHAIALAPDDGMPDYELASIYQDANQLDLALPLIEKACARLPAHGWAWFTFGEIAARVGQDSLADFAYRHVIAIKPQFAPAYVERAALLTKYGRADEAIQSLEQALAMDPNDPKLDVARLNLGVLYAARGRDAAADSVWTRIVATSADTTLVAQARQNLARLAGGVRPMLPAPGTATPASAPSSSGAALSHAAAATGAPAARRTPAR